MLDKSLSIWDSFTLACILQNGDLLFRYLNNYRYIGMEDLPHEFLIENSSINAEFLNNRTGEITAGGYLVSITEIMSDCQQIDRGALLIINNYIFFIWVFFHNHSRITGLQWKREGISLTPH